MAKRRRQLTGAAQEGLAWSADSTAIYTLDDQALVAVDVANGRVRPIRTFDDRVHFGVPTNPGQRFTISRDGPQPAPAASIRRVGESASG